MALSFSSPTELPFMYSLALLLGFVSLSKAFSFALISRAKCIPDILVFGFLRAGVRNVSYLSILLSEAASVICETSSWSRRPGLYLGIDAEGEASNLDIGGLIA